MSKRDQISHGYDTVDYQLLWDAARNDLPTLSETAQIMLRDLDDEGSASEPQPAP